MLASMLLLISSVIALVAVNVRFSNEAADTFPPALLDSLSGFVLRETEAILSAPAHLHNEIAAELRSGLRAIPLFNLTDPSAPLPANSTVLAEQYAIRQRWSRESVTDAIREVKSNPLLLSLSVSFLNDAQSNAFTGFDGVGDCVQTQMYYGDDVRWAEKNPDSVKLHTFRYDPADPTQHHVDLTVRDDVGYFRRFTEGYAHPYFFWEENAFVSQNVPPDQRALRLMVNLGFGYDRAANSYYTAQYVDGPLRDPEGRLIGITEQMVESSIECFPRLKPPSARRIPTRVTLSQPSC